MFRELRGYVCICVSIRMFIPLLGVLMLAYMPVFVDILGVTIIFIKTKHKILRMSHIHKVINGLMNKYEKMIYYTNKNFIYWKPLLCSMLIGNIRVDFMYI